MKLKGIQNLTLTIKFKYFKFIKYLSASLLIYLFQSSILFAINYPQLTQKELLARCYNQITGIRLGSSSNLWQRLNQESATSICFGLLNNVHFDDQGILTTPDNSLNRSILKQFIDLHKTWFDIQWANDSTFPDNFWGGVDVYDPQEPALFLTRNLILGEHYSKVLSGDLTAVAQRDGSKLINLLPSSANGFLRASRIIFRNEGNIVNSNNITYANPEAPTAKDYVSLNTPIIQIGEPIGIKLVSYQNEPLLPTIWTDASSTLVTGKPQGLILPNGGGRPMSDLLPHLISFRGYGTGADGHLANSIKQSNPIPSAGSIAGHVADQSSLLFRALQFPPLTGLSGYNSIRSTGLTLLFDQGKNNYLTNLLSPFIPQNSTATINQANLTYESSINEVHKQIRFVASQKYSGLDPLSLDFENSLKTLKTGIEDLESSWSQLYNKYESIILKNIKDRNVSGFSDKPILATKNLYFRTTVNGKDLYPSAGSDLRDWLINVDCNNLITSFALSEFVLTRGYGSALEFGFLNPKNIQGYFGDNIELSTFDFAFDQHTTGVVPSTFINGMFFKAFSAGLLELIDQLKRTSQFNKTIIHLVQEFGRSPISDGSGSDHAFDAMVSTVFTGLNNSRPIVVGNIAKASALDLPTYHGTYGAKEPTLIGSDELLLTPAHITSTIANLMQLPINPWANVASPLIIRSNDSLSIIASGNIV